MSDMETRYESIKLRVHQLSTDVQKAITQAELNKLEVGHVKTSVEELKNVCATKQQVINVTDKVDDMRKVMIAILGAIILAVVGAVVSGVLK